MGCEWTRLAHQRPFNLGIDNLSGVSSSDILGFCVCSWASFHVVHRRRFCPARLNGNAAAFPNKRAATLKKAMAFALRFGPAWQMILSPWCVFWLSSRPLSCCSCLRERYYAWSRATNYPLSRSVANGVSVKATSPNSFKASTSCDRFMAFTYN